MAGINKLTDLKIEATVASFRKLIKAGKQPTSGKLLGDGGGLTLQLTPTATTSWLFRYMRDGKARSLGLGPYPAVSLKAAREKAVEFREIVASGGDPGSSRVQLNGKKTSDKERTITFQECALTYIALQKGSWKNAKHQDQWRNTLSTYAYPVIGDRPVDEVNFRDIVKILSPIWVEKTETASRLRGRIESILGWATVNEYRTGDNPARWSGHLEHLLPKLSRQRTQQHFPSMPFSDVPGFVAKLQHQEGMARWALEFTVLTACRTGEVIGARWSEFDFDKNIWTIPGERMKAGVQHRVPLVDRTLEILATLKPFSSDEFVFVGAKSAKNPNTVKPLSNMAMTMVLRRMEVTDATVHGFRSSFRVWVGEATEHAREVAEAALAHQLESKVEAAYSRGDFYEKRFALMKDWANFCLGRLQTSPDQKGGK